MVGTVKMVNLHYRAKFCGDGQHVAGIWRFFQDGGRSHLEFFKLEIFLKVGHVRRVELRHRAKFHSNRSNSCRDIAVYRFLKMAAAAILDFSIF